MSIPTVLTINTGSSSIKVAAYSIEAGQLGARLLKANLSGLPKTPAFFADTRDGPVDELPDSIAQAAGETGALVAALAEWAAGALPDTALKGVGHRVVHGGQAFAGPVRATPEVLARVGKLGVFAPSHQPQNLAGIEGVTRLWPEVAQVLSFDTAFHRTQPRTAQLYAIPRRFSEAGLLRFGFHGLSYAHIAGVMSDILPGAASGKVIAAHLGSGASLCAMSGGRSVATSMGLTALDGVPMATRPGQLDPGLVLHLIREEGMSAEAVSDMLYKESGLCGLSGISGDVRVLLDSNEAAAREALDVYAYRIAREIGSLAAALQGVDALVFTGGVGENAWQVRERICAQLGWLGAELDRDANEAGREQVQSTASQLVITVIPADEECVIARETLSLLTGS